MDEIIRQLSTGGFQNQDVVIFTQDEAKGSSSHEGGSNFNSEEDPINNLNSTSENHQAEEPDEEDQSVTAAEKKARY
jgi:hypothetical protein